MKSIVIAGAGVIGLATALEFAKRGHRVTVLERGRVLTEASWAAAGMLAGSDPENPAALAPLARLSLDLYPQFLSRLKTLSGISVPIQTRQTLQVVDRRAAEVALADAPTERRRTRIDDLEEAVQACPGVRFGQEQRALWLEEQSIDPRVLGAALAGAAKAVGVEVHEQTPMISVREQCGRMVVGTPSGYFHADSVVVTTGAWAADPGFGSLTLPKNSIVPRKGQMLRVRQPIGAILHVVLRSADIYIVPRKNGSLILGATVENAGFDRTIRREATEWLLGQAARLWEPLERIKFDQVEEVWTGIRPGTPDHLPILGRMDDARVWFATGHYRNGILLTPATAQVMANLICGDEVAVDLGCFAPGRFTNRMEHRSEAGTEAYETVCANGNHS